MIPFKKQSIVAVIFFSFLTLGIYPAAWLYGYRDAFDALQSQKKLSLPWIIVAIVAYCASAIMILLVFVVPDPNQVKTISDLAQAVSLIGAIAVLIESLKARHILDDHYNGALKMNVTFSKTLTFFFTILYLQYKMNKILEMEQPAPPQAPLK